MIRIGQRVECLDEKSSNFSEKGTFIGWVANGLKVKFDNGREGLYLASDLKKI